MTTRRHVLRLAAAAALSPCLPAGAQIPVTDVAHIVEGAVRHLEVIRQWIEAIRYYQQQLQQLQNTYNSLTGARGYEALLNGAAEQLALRYLPDELSEVVTALSAEVGAYERLISTFQDGHLPAGYVNSEYRAILRRIATFKATGDATYRATTQRIGKIVQLIQAIGGTDDPKAIAELQARIQGEQVLTQNDANRLAALAYQQTAEIQTAERRALENLKSRGSAAVIGFPSITAP